MKTVAVAEEGKVVVVAGEDGLGDDGRNVDLGGEGLVVRDHLQRLVVLDEGSRVERDGGVNRGLSHGLVDDAHVLRVRVADDVGSVDVAQSVVDDVAGETAGGGASHCQNGGEYCL